MADSSHHKDFPVSWEEIHRNARALAWKLSEKGPLDKGGWKGVVAVTRGGLVPACIVARELGVLLVETLCISSYDVKEQGKAQVLKTPSMATEGGKGWLVIDDLVDTGNTFRIAREILPGAHYACVYAKPMGADTTDTFFMEVSQNTWIHFPWEDNEYTPSLSEDGGGTKTNS